MQKVIRVFSALTVVSGLLAFVYLAFLPGDGRNFSPFRLMSLAVILAVICVSIFSFFKFGSARKSAELTARIQGLRFGLALSFVFFAAALTAWITFLYRESVVSLMGEAVYERLSPLLLLGALVCMQAGIIFIFPNFIEKKNESLKRVWKIMLFILGGFSLIAIFISLTGIGFTFDNVGLNWGPAGTPLSFAQVNLVLSIGFLLSFLMHVIGSRIKDGHSRLLLVLDV